MANPSISAPCIFLLEVISQELVPEASFSHALLLCLIGSTSSLAHWMLCCSLVALLTLILCEGSFVPVKKEQSVGKTNQGEQGSKNQERKVRKQRSLCGTRQVREGPSRNAHNPCFKDFLASTNHKLKLTKPRLNTKIASMHIILSLHNRRQPSSLCEDPLLWGGGFICKENAKI